MQCTENLLYVLTCMGFNEYYVGQTSNALRERNRVHKQQVLHQGNANCPASKHIAKYASNLPDSYKIMPFFKINSPNPSLRDSKEFCFIKKTKVKLNTIINTNFSLSIQINSIVVIRPSIHGILGIHNIFVV